MTAFNIEELIKLRLAEVQRDRDAMHLYQEECVEFMQKNPFSALFIDMGMGKTISSLTVISELLSNFEAEKVLIIAPLRVATDTWPTEIGSWWHTAWMNHVVIRADDDDPRLKVARNRARKFCKSEGLGREETQKVIQRTETQERHRIMVDLANSPASIHIINREQVEWLVYLFKEKWPYKVVFIDESQSFKDHKTNRFKALAKVRQSGFIDRLHLLTATPAAETYEHLFAQLYLLDLGARLGKNITAYRERHFIYNKWSMKWKLRPGSEEEILAKIADICLVMRANDYLPRKEPTIIQRKVHLAVDQLALIKQLERDFIVNLPDGTEIEAKTAAALSSMLLQMASGSLYETAYIEDWDTDDLKKVKKVHHLHDHKIETLKEIYEEAQTQGEPLLVAYHFQSSLARLKKAFPKAVAMDKEGKCIKDWNKKKISMLLVHPQSAGHGLNLQHGGRMLVFFDLIYSLEFYLQTVGRLDRQGQLGAVVIMLLVAAGTRDELVFDCLNQKQDAQEKLFTILKKLIRQFKKARLAEEAL
jgi:SNF2-related domain